MMKCLILGFFLICLLLFPIEIKANIFVFGFSNNEVLAFDKDIKGTVCSKKHLDNDLSNKWCHSFFSKLNSDFLQLAGFSEEAASLLAGLTFAPKEFLIDKKASFGDIGIVEYPVINQLKISVFGDLTVIFSISNTF